MDTSKSARRPQADRDYSRKGLTGLNDGDTERWFTDPRISQQYQLPDRFFTKDNGAFDKGHIVRRDDVAWGKTYDEIVFANGDTYHTTNCSPQVATFNRSTSGTDNWGKAAQALQMISAAKARGLDVDCDAYPYAAGSNPLKNILPAWVQAGGVEAMLGRLGQRETRERIRADIARHGLNNWGRIPSWDCVQVSISPNLPQHQGRTIGALAQEQESDPIDTLCQYLLDDKGATRVLVTSISEDDIAEIVRSPTALVGSDGNCVATTGTVSQGMPHPRFYGTFQRITSGW